MADKIFSSSESSSESTRRSELAPEKGQKTDSKEIKERSKEFIEGVSEVVESTEAAEFVEGKVGETTGEDKKKGPQGTMSGNAQSSQMITKSKELPTIEIMQIQVATQIKSEIRVLEKEISRLMSANNFSPYKLNDVMSRIRSLRHILAELAYASAEMLKDWWMKFVKGVTQ